MSDYGVFTTMRQKENPNAKRGYLTQERRIDERKREVGGESIFISRCIPPTTKQMQGVVVRCSLQSQTGRVETRRMVIDRAEC